MLKKLKERVTFLLLNVPETRENDNVLVTEFWKLELNEKFNVGISSLSALDFFECYMSNQLSCADNISRTARRIKSEVPSLRGSNYEYKQKLTEEYKKQLRTFYKEDPKNKHSNNLNIFID